MEFVDQFRTIAAIATAAGSGGVAIIRMSGKQAIAIASKVFSGPVAAYKSHTLHYGYICTPNGEKVDDVLLVVMKGPKSFTGEDIVEIHCHGGAYLAKKILSLCLDAGASPAAPGEFSMRAYLHGKLDLTQAEAIQAKIAATSDKALMYASEQLEGVLSKKIRSWQIELTDIAAILEAHVDFPEEDLEFASQEEVISQLNKVMKEIETLSGSYRYGKMVQEGIAVCLVGSPNVGKSSLMNALLGKERAIVSPVPGTTRDLVEDCLQLSGFHLRLIDTAGIRKTEEALEEEGIRRSKSALERADIILLVLDSKESNSIDPFFYELPPEKTIAIWNKQDLIVAPIEYPIEYPLLPYTHTAFVSAKNQDGLELLKQKIDILLAESASFHKEEALLTNVRHLEALASSLDACRKVRDGLQNALFPEFIAYDMRQALSSLGRIIGQDILEDVLTAVFSKFCIGK